ncbi:VWA domain-containing protein [Pseudohalioglobus sediminis]|uniref:VWA domain-containing protein n=1 Tax=Pseudohalioglobus sediminis TaxID=2606449 RepID=A0A5B0WSD8_9GAMM|nr:VWA domain-containing protein [Pseudohalioglobus sediminis]KAA1189934.1 VWA domain-containing protein [Pseudohalioglobus sediminis]
MPESLVSFIQVLRTRDVRISPAETLDATNVLAVLGWSDRARLRDGLGMALAKTPEEEAIFNQCFDQFFARQLADFSDSSENEPAIEEEDSSAGDDPTGVDSDSSRAELPSPLEQAAAADPALQAVVDSPLVQALMNNDSNTLSLAMSKAGERAGLQNIQMFTQKGQFTRRILEAMGEEQLRSAVIELEKANSPAQAQLQRYRDILRQQVRDYVEAQYLLHAEGKTRQFMEEVLSKTRLSNIEHSYLHRVHELVRKMARKLAARHSRKRREYRRGHLDMPRTMRRGVVNDGLMFDVYWRRTRREKPQILAICDVSGSVAAYAKFLLLFLYSLQDVLPRVRSFAFSSHLGEVSDLFEQHPVEKAIELVNWKYGGATDYGTALGDFASLALDDINSNTTVIILGDARNNRGDPRLDILQSIYQRSRQVIWLNPESRIAWGTGDSEMLRYQSACHFAAECNNLKQLERIIDQLLKSTR